MFFIIVIVFLTSLDAIKAHVLILEEAYHCSQDSIILLNYTYNKATHSGAGYVNIVENIEADSNTLISIAIQQNNKDNVLRFFKPSFNITKSDLCVLVNTDVLFIPRIRQFVNIGKKCPINKGIYPIQKHTMNFKETPIFPNGCWRVEVTIERNRKIISCFRVTIKLL